jgi:predicted cation transporter
MALAARDDPAQSGAGLVRPSVAYFDFRSGLISINICGSLASGNSMSLQTVTGKIDGIIQGAALLLTFGIWAAYGFPFIPELVAFGCLVIVCIVIHWWMTSRPQKEK